MADALGFDLHVFAHGGARPARYFRCIRDTCSLIRRTRPSIIVGQNPSIVLAYLLVALRSIYKFRLVIDAHFAGVVAPGENTIFQYFLDRVNRAADIVIVTNKNHAERVQSVGGNALVCRDPLPRISQHASADEVMPRTVLFVCSYDVDEPFLAVFQAAELLSQEGFRVFATGRFAKVGINPDSYPGVTFLGYVSEEEYYRTMARTEVVLDLTENEDCLVCGAYEAMASGRPLVTSRRVCLMEYFNRGVVYTKHTAFEIADAIRYASENRLRLEREVSSWCAEVHERERMELASLRRNLVVV